ncbi:CatB-related O-acetyltransferase [Tunturiibacter lichenicola]|jgi:acetyltransferase-like isoleucine patch superfamily enzyme|uniref:CatB-related O-acetyltransferase n=1 Tax=Tunturiibacter lichenicola TaxID=2051959 RepID=UPI003D9BDE73
MTRVKTPFTRDALAKCGAAIGEYSYGVPVLRWWGEAVGLRIGNYCSFADRVEIFLGGNHRPDFVTTYPFASFTDWPEVPGVRIVPETRGDVVIGNDVWVGSGAVILSGITIGDGAIIGARAVVSRNVPPYSVVVGNPARVVRKRFTDDVIQQLLRIRWWDWSRQRIEQNLPLLLSSDLSKFLAGAAEE